MPLFKNSLYIFTRDLRLSDNHALFDALQSSERVHCLFLLDPQLLSHARVKRAAKQFLYSALVELRDSLHEIDGDLSILSISCADKLREYLTCCHIDSIFVSCEYTPYGLRRKAMLQQLADDLSIPFYCIHNHLLFSPGMVLSNDAKPYRIFTPFFKKASTLPIERPRKIPSSFGFAPAYKEFAVDVGELALLLGVNHDRFPICKARIDVLNGLQQLCSYSIDRDFPAKEATSYLSVHLKFGTISVREAYWAIVDALGSEAPLLRQLYWRDFFTHIGFFYPHVFNKPFNLQYANIQWSMNQDHFQRWCAAKTGFPIVDAGMRELNQTGFMHNRVRMITASFLIKDLHIHWRWGERYFAEQLIDYDVAVNNGNWQWVASTGCDAQPYFRVFNPWLQQKKFDPDCAYIYRWLPELRHLKPAQIHRLHEVPFVADYPLPIVKHSLAVQEVKALYAFALESFNHA